MKTVLNNSVHNLKRDIKEKRVEWRRIRAERLARKEELESQGCDKREIRRDKVFRRLRKQQDAVSTVIKHKERVMNRKIAGLNLEK